MFLVSWSNDTLSIFKISFYFDTERILDTDIIFHKESVMGFAENLKMLMKEKSKTADDIAKLMGVSRGTVTHWSNGVRFPQDDGKIRLLASVLGVSEQELLNPERRLHVKAYDGAISIPILEGLAGCGSAGALEQLRLTEDNMVIDKRIFPADIISKNLAMIRIVGDSMQPYLDENDWAIVQMRNGADVVLTGAVYMLARGDDVQIKRCTFKPDGTCVIISDNQLYPIEEAPMGEWEVLGKVVARLKVGSPFLIKE